MAEDETIKDAIKASAAGPQMASDDSTTMRQHDLDKQIMADKYVKDQAAAANPNGGVRYRRIVPGNRW